MSAATIHDNNEFAIFGWGNSDFTRESILHFFKSATMRWLRSWCQCYCAGCVSCTRPYGTSTTNSQIVSKVKSRDSSIVFQVAAATITSFVVIINRGHWPSNASPSAKCVRLESLRKNKMKNENWKCARLGETIHNLFFIIVSLQ